MKTQTLKTIRFGFITVLFLASQTAHPALGVPETPASVDKKPVTIVHKSARPSTAKTQKPRPDKMILAQMQNGGASGNLGQITEIHAAMQDNVVSIKVRGTQPLEYTAFKLLNPLRLILDFPGQQRGDIQNILEVNRGVVNSIRTLYFEEAQVTRLEIGLNKAATYEIIKTGTHEMDIRLTEAPQSQAGKNAPPKKTAVKAVAMQQTSTQNNIYVDGMGRGQSDTCRKLLDGEKDKISLDFQNANIKNIFRIISEVSGFNVVLSPDVQGTANVRLVDVPWNTALELILENNGLGRECDRNIIRIAPKATLAAAREGELLVTEMIRVSYADINELIKNLQGLRSQDRGTVSADVRTNTIILTDTQSKIDEMVSVIKTLDVATPQVMIESKIIEVRRNFAQELGIKWGVNTRRNTFKPDTFPAITEVSGTTPSGFAVDLGTASGAPTAGIGFLLSTTDADHVLELQLEALEEQGKSRTIANPKVTTLDNKEAKIKSGQKIPYQTTSANEGTKIAFVDADLSLNVTPHITAEEDIYMKIAALQNSADFSNQVNGVPVITTKEAFTEVLVDNGATTVLGGLYQKESSDSRESVPYLSQIPLLGYLFRNRSESDDISELLIFVTPTIVRDNVASGS